jgi:hypothetical protein
MGGNSLAQKGRKLTAYGRQPTEEEVEELRVEKLKADEEAEACDMRMDARAGNRGRSGRLVLTQSSERAQRRRLERGR